MPVYDALYAWCVDQVGGHAETHNWRPAMTVPRQRELSGRPCASGSSWASSASVARPVRSPSCTANWWKQKRWISEQRFPARAELLHAAARTGGAAARHLHRLAAAPHLGRCGGGCAVRAAVAADPDRPELGLCGPWPGGLGRGTAVRHQAGGGGAGACRRCTAWAARRCDTRGARRCCGPWRWGVFWPWPFLGCRFPWSCWRPPWWAGWVDAGCRTSLRATGGGHPSAAATTAAHQPAVIDDHTPTPDHARFSRARLLRVLSGGAVLWALPMGALVAWKGWHGHARHHGLVLHQGGTAHLRRRLRGVALCVPGRGGGARLAARAADDRRPGAGRNHAGAADHGGGLCGLSWAAGASRCWGRTRCFWARRWRRWWSPGSLSCPRSSSSSRAARWSRAPTASCISPRP